MTSKHINDQSAKHRSPGDPSGSDANSNALFFLESSQNSSAGEVQNWFDSFLISGNVHFLVALLELCENVSGFQAAAIVKSISVASVRLPHPTRLTVITPMAYGKAVDLAVHGLHTVPDDEERMKAASSLVDDAASLRFAVDVVRRFCTVKPTFAAASKTLSQRLATRITKHIFELVTPVYICEPEDAAAYFHFLSWSGNLDTVRRYLATALAEYPKSAYEFLNAVCANVALRIPTEEPAVIPLHGQQYRWLKTIVDTALVAEGLNARLNNRANNRSSTRLELDWEEKVAMKFITFREAASATAGGPGPGESPN